jgi:hypothetical protein
MCDWTIDWGDVPTWLGALGTFLAFGLALILYRGSARDSMKAQARLLSPVGGASATVATAGTLVSPSASSPKRLLTRIPNIGVVVAEEAVYSTVRLVSTSGESFTDIRTWLVMSDGTEVYFEMTPRDFAPHEDATHTVYFSPGTVKGEMQVRVQFRDSNGRWWERLTGEPVRRLKSGPRDREVVDYS